MGMEWLVIVRLLSTTAYQRPDDHLGTFLTCSEVIRSVQYNRRGYLAYTSTSRKHLPAHATPVGLVRNYKV